MDSQGENEDGATEEEEEDGEEEEEEEEEGDGLIVAEAPAFLGRLQVRHCSRPEISTCHCLQGSRRSHIAPRGTKLGSVVQGLLSAMRGQQAVLNRLRVSAIVGLCSECRGVVSW